MAKRVLLSTIGTRGDVQPLVALASELRAAGCEVRLCVPPDFCAWLAELGFEVVPIGPALRASAPPPVTRPTPEQIQHMIDGTVAAQFATLGDAARGCDAIVGATALQVAAPSIAEHLRIPYVFVAYSPCVLPSPRHAPPVLAMLGQRPAPAAADYSELWAREAQRWTDTWRGPVDAGRAALGLPPLATGVWPYVATAQPWLAADAALAPWPDSSTRVVQTGAWLLDQRSALPRELAAFVDAGEPPVYFGFGSARAPAELANAMIAAARALNRRALLSRGWAELALPELATDCLAIDEVDHALLFPRCAAVVHHGGAGTTTAAARAGAPQVILPQHYDQHDWARRVRTLGIGVEATIDTLTESLDAALALPRSTLPIRSDGARVAADLVTRL